LKRGIAFDQSMPRLGKGAVLNEKRLRRLEGAEQNIPRAKLRRRVAHRPHQDIAERGFAAEQHIAFVGEMSKEGALSHACLRGDVGGRRLFVPAFSEQFQGGLLETAAYFLSVSRHASNHVKVIVSN
jgi:hypothetical protein